MKVCRGQNLEYHLMGMEIGAAWLPGPGWYSCVVDEIYENGNVEISFTSPDLDGLACTVLRKNIPVAFREKQQEA